MYIKQTENVIILANASCPTKSNMPKSGPPFRIWYLNMILMCCVIPTLLCCCAFCYRTALQELKFSDAPHAPVVQRWLSRCQSGLAACLKARLSMTNFSHLRTRISAFSWRQTGSSRGWFGTAKAAPTEWEVVFTVEGWLWCGCHTIFFL